MTMNDRNHKEKHYFSRKFTPKIPRNSQNFTWQILVAILLLTVLYCLFKYSDIDKFLATAIIALAGITLEMFSHLFSYFLTLVQSIPYIGPMIAKLITWPIFVTLNITAYFVSLIVIRFKGISMVKDARILTTIFLIGLLTGFILGRLF
ncbi:MAG: hypothetical protein JXC36_00515 [Candidatus Atribacteria bacterium]|nr:hypothetical protein [Candidatus Atribacteria bacterium]